MFVYVCVYVTLLLSLGSSGEFDDKVIPGSVPALEIKKKRTPEQIAFDLEFDTKERRKLFKEWLPAERVPKASTLRDTFSRNGCAEKSSDKSDSSSESNLSSVSQSRLKRVRVCNRLSSIVSFIRMYFTSIKLQTAYMHVFIHTTHTSHTYMHICSHMRIYISICSAHQ
jgi:hypothetical protein